MKKTRKILALLLAAVMVFAMSVSAFAAEPQSQPEVTLVIERQDANQSEPTVCMRYTAAFVAKSTVYSVVNTHTTATWKTVDILDPNTWQPTGDKAQALESVTFSRGAAVFTWTNNGTSTPDATGNHGHYEGQSWVYTVVRNGQTLTPDIYMDQFIVQAGDEIHLNYQFSSFDW